MALETDVRAYLVEIVVVDPLVNKTHRTCDEEMPLKNQTYWYSRERGITELSAAARRELKVPMRRIQVPRTDLGPWIWRTAAGDDAIVANAALRAFGNVGRLSVAGSRDGYDLARCDDVIVPVQQKRSKRRRKQRRKKQRRRYLSVALAWLRKRSGFFGRIPLLKKASIAVKTFFLIFSTSTLSSYTLRETQTRMLRFASLIKERVSNRKSYVPLVTAHLLDSVVFAPITLGMLSFLYEFFFDQLLALLILSLIWGCELFNAVSLRSMATIKVLPHLIVLYLAALHVYIFAFPLGFHYVAFGTCVAAIGHAMFFFWHHFELPALLAGIISPSKPRAIYDYLPGGTSSTPRASLQALAASASGGGPSSGGGPPPARIADDDDDVAGGTSQ